MEFLVIMMERSRQQCSRAWSKPGRTRSVGTFCSTLPREFKSDQTLGWQLDVAAVRDEETGWNGRPQSGAESLAVQEGVTKCE